MHCVDMNDMIQLCQRLSSSERKVLLINKSLSDWISSSEITFSYCDLFLSPFQQEDRCLTFPHTSRIGCMYKAYKYNLQHQVSVHALQEKKQARNLKFIVAQFLFLNAIHCIDCFRYIIRSEEECCKIKHTIFFISFPINPNKEK